MIAHRVGDITADIGDKSVIIAHGVNCQGVMGSGVAGAIARKWPSARQLYLDFVELEFKNGLSPTDLLGDMVVWTSEQYEVLIAHCFTQVTYGKTGVHASAHGIEQSLTKFKDWIDYMRFSSDVEFRIPRIGSGLGGLSWDDDVSPIVERLFADTPYTLYVYSL